MLTSHLRFRVFTIIFALLACSGCAQTIGSTRFPEPSADYTPKKEYAASFDTVWKAVHETLDNNRIVVATESKEDGRIATEYIQGQSQMNALGLLGTISTRYKYNIRLAKSGARSTTVTILSMLESSGNAMPAWRDVSSDNKAVVSQLENWLYEQTEQALAK